MDRWLLIFAIAGPLAGVVCGAYVKVSGFYEIVRDDHNTVNQLAIWKDRQEDFNKVIIAQIAELKALSR